MAFGDRLPQYDIELFNLRSNNRDDYPSTYLQSHGTTLYVSYSRSRFLAINSLNPSQRNFTSGLEGAHYDGTRWWTGTAESGPGPRGIGRVYHIVISSFNRGEVFRFETDSLMNQIWICSYQKNLYILASEPLRSGELGNADLYIYDYTGNHIRTVRNFVLIHGRSNRTTWTNGQILLIEGANVSFIEVAALTDPWKSPGHPGTNLSFLGVPGPGNPHPRSTPNDNNSMDLLRPDPPPPAVAHAGSYFQPSLNDFTVTYDPNTDQIIMWYFFTQSRRPRKDWLIAYDFDYRIGDFTYKNNITDFKYGDVDITIGTYWPADPFRHSDTFRPVKPFWLPGNLPE